MERQMDDAIRREPVFLLRSLIATGTVVASGTGAVALRGIESLHNSQGGEFVTGAATLLSVGFSVLWCVREWSRVSELSTVKYRNNHKDRLQNLDGYNHAFDSSSARIRNLFAEEENPLGILNIDRYKKSDLKKIIMETNREEAIRAQGITYVKTK